MNGSNNNLVLSGTVTSLVMTISSRKKWESDYLWWILIDFGHQLNGCLLDLFSHSHVFIVGLFPEN